MNGYGNPYLEPLLMREMRERLNPPTTWDLVAPAFGGRNLTYNSDPRHDPYALALRPRRVEPYEDPRGYESPVREIIPRRRTEQWYDDSRDWKSNLSERERRELRGY